MLNMCLETLNLNQAGPLGGPSVLAFYRLHIQHPRPEWSSRAYPLPFFFLFLHFYFGGKPLWDMGLQSHRMCEEVQHPSKQVPKAIVGTVILNTLAGFLFLIPLVFVLPDSQELIALVSGQPVPTIMKSAVGNSTGAFLLLLPLIVLALICGIGCTTTVSRSIWAFARDGGIPYSSKWRQVNKSLDVPFNAMMLGMVVEIALGLIYFGSTTAFNAFSGVGVITLTVSYACPIAVSFMGGRKEIKHGDFDLGKLGAVCNVVALGMIQPFSPFGGRIC